MRRSEARELFMQLLFQMEVQNDYTYDFRDKYFLENNIDIKEEEYLYKLSEYVLGNLDLIDEQIDNTSIRWKMSRMAKVDIAILRISIAEILLYDDIPDSVSINEAVEMAKRFSGEESSKFVNGLLGKIQRNKEI